MPDAPSGTRYDDLVRAVASGDLTADAAADRLIAELDDDELLRLLDGDSPRRRLLLIPFLLGRRPFVAGAVPRLGIPGIRFSDGARGVVIGRSTAFPVSMARAATWDPELEERVGHAIGLETRARDANYSASVCVNLLHHPAWGRAQECYGEDSVLTGRMGVAMTRGLRANVMACVKHFALNSMENRRFEVDVLVDDHALHEVYLPHFKATVDAGVDSVMSAYNRVRGRYMDLNHELLTEVLRDEWGFAGFVTSDWVFGTHDGVASLEAGMDVEMPLRLLRARQLPWAVRTGALTRDTILRSARRILRTTLAHAAARDPRSPDASVVASAEHRALAREVAAESVVLLKNEPVRGARMLPFDPGIRRIAVVGRLAQRANLGDHGSSRVRPPTSSSPLDGLREALPAAQFVTPRGQSARAAAAAAEGADAAVVVVGLDEHDEGESVITEDIEVAVLGRIFRSGPLRAPLVAFARFASRFVRGGDRRSLDLRRTDIEMIRAVTAANPRTVVVLVGGSAILTQPWDADVPALLMAWYGGMEGGRARADVLTGAADPGGRLPFVVPVTAEHLPRFDRTATTVVYADRWGQRGLDADGNLAAYPFGHGLSYTSFEHRLLSHRADGTGGIATVRVANTGERAGSTVVQIYASDASAARPIARLLGFQKVRLAPGADAVVTVDLDLTPLRQRDPGTREWSERPGDWVLVAAQRHPDDWSGAVPLRQAGELPSSTS
ncbi:MAG: beta-glucosidase [Pseudolysinimonas sp.]